MFSSLLLGLSLNLPAAPLAAQPPQPLLALPYCHTGAYGAPPSVMLAALHAEHAICRKRLTKAYVLAPTGRLGINARRSVR